MSSVEKDYREALGRWSGCERVARTALLFSEFRGMLLHKARLANPSASERDLLLDLAKSLYRTDAGTLKLIAAIDD